MFSAKFNEYIVQRVTKGFVNFYSKISFLCSLEVKQSLLSGKPCTVDSRYLDFAYLE